jgi:hypothetical protein
MKIEIESAMRRAARENIDAYQPMFRGEPLDVEASLPEVSLKNLTALLDAGLRVSSMTVVENGNVLVAFETGETYLATGFSVGVEAATTTAFAKFAAKAYGCDVKEWIAFLVDHYAEDHQGPIAPSLLPSRRKPRLHKAD